MLTALLFASELMSLLYGVLSWVVGDGCVACDVCVICRIAWCVDVGCYVGVGVVVVIG